MTSDVFSTDRGALLAGLEATIKARQAVRGDVAQMSAVYVALQVYGPDKELPLGLNDRLFRFFIVSAAAGAWDALHERDPRRVTALLKYFTSSEDVSTETVGEYLGVSQERASQLLTRSLRFLWTRLPERPTPDFPIDKQVVFPLQDLLAMSVGKHARRMRERAADPVARQEQQDSMRQAREQNWATWPGASDDTTENAPD